MRLPQPVLKNHGRSLCQLQNPVVPCAISYNIRVNNSGYLAGQLRPSPLAFWIGLSDRQVEGEFRWVNGEPLSYQNFAPGEPNNTTPEGREEDFVALALDPSYNPVIGYWNDGNQERGQVRGIIEIEQQNLPN
jgi:hypothetical protein